MSSSSRRRTAPSIIISARCAASGALATASPFPPRRFLPRRIAPVLVQPNEHPGAEPALIAPFRLDTSVDFRLYRPLGTPHGFVDSQAAWDNGRMGAWPRSKQNQAMAHFTREDLPFQYGLAEAFTLCDAYHCAPAPVHQPQPALHLDRHPRSIGQGQRPRIDNGYDSLDADPLRHGGYLWTTYPERLMAAGVGFQIYQDMADNFTDNPLGRLPALSPGAWRGRGRGRGGPALTPDDDDPLARRPAPGRAGQTAAGGLVDHCSRRPVGASRRFHAAPGRGLCGESARRAHRQSGRLGAYRVAHQFRRE